MNEIKYVQLEPAAFLSDIDFQMMSAEERGVYCSIIFYLYCNGGKIQLPNNSDITLLSDKTTRLAAISNCLKGVKDWQAIWSKMAHKFIISDNILSHKRVLIEIEKAKTFYNDKSRAGKLGMKNRWQDNTVIPPVITKVSKGKVSKDKDIYMEYVYLSKDEYAKLVTTLGEQQTKDKIESLNNYIGSKGVKYKSHYHTILNWIRRDGGIKSKIGTQTAKPKNCFVCKEPAKIEIQTGRGTKPICDDCKKLLNAAPKFVARGGMIIAKERLEPLQIEDMIQKQKAMR